MQHENMQLRDPVMYRIRRGHHHRTHDAWVDLPDLRLGARSERRHRRRHPLAVLARVRQPPCRSTTGTSTTCRSPFEQPRQIEFARLELTHTVTSKRKPRQARRRRRGRRMGRPAPAHHQRALRRRGYPSARDQATSAPSSACRQAPTVVTRSSCSRASCATNSTAPPNGAWPCCVRSSSSSPTGPPARSRSFEIQQQPRERRRRCPRGRRSSGRTLDRARGLHGRRTAPKYFRLTPGREVRLRGAYFVTCTRATPLDDDGNVVEVQCTYDPDTRGGNAHRRAQGEVDDALGVGRPQRSTRPSPCTSGFFSAEVPGEATGEPLRRPQPERRGSCSPAARSRPPSATRSPGQVVQFERLGYFAHDPHGTICSSIARSVCATNGRTFRSGADMTMARQARSHAAARPRAVYTKRLEEEQRRLLQLRLHLGGEMGSGDKESAPVCSCCSRAPTQRARAVRSR